MLLSLGGCQDEDVHYLRMPSVISIPESPSAHMPSLHRTHLFRGRPTQTLSKYANLSRSYRSRKQQSMTHVRMKLEIQGRRLMSRTNLPARAIWQLTDSTGLPRHRSKHEQYCHLERKYRILVATMHRRGVFARGTRCI